MDIVDCIMGIMYIVALVCVLYFINKFQISKLKRDSKPINKVHFYVARDLDGSLWIFIGKPFRETNIFNARIPGSCTRLSDNKVFKYFGLNKNDYDSLKWGDEPIEVFLNLED